MTSRSRLATIAFLVCRLPAASALRRAGRRPRGPHRPPGRPDAGCSSSATRLTSARTSSRSTPTTCPRIRSRGARRGRHIVRPAARGRRLGPSRHARGAPRRLSRLRRHGPRRRLRQRPGRLGRQRPRLHRAHHPARRRRRLPQRAHGLRRTAASHLAVLELPFGNDTPQSDPHDWGNVTAEHDAGRLLEGPPLVAVWRQLGPWNGPWASQNQLQVIKPYWAGNMLMLRTPVTVSSLALRCSSAPAAPRSRSTLRQELLRLQHRRPARHGYYAHLRGHLRRDHQHRRAKQARRPFTSRRRPATARRASAWTAPASSTS